MFNHIENELLPNALMIGVDYDLFWTLNPRSLSPFVKAFDLKQKYDDGVAWQHGVYVQQAIASCLNKSSKYPTKPMMSKTTYREVPMSAEQIKARVMAQMNVINSKLGKE